MKKIFKLIIAVIIAMITVFTCALGVSATDGSDAIMSETAAESFSDASEAVSEVEGETAATESEIDRDLINEIISNTETPAQAIIKLAELFGITVEDAEAMIDKFIAFGDDNFEDSDVWATVKQDVETHPDKWILICVIVLAIIALVVFLIRSVIKNTVTQTNTKLRMASIESHAAAVEKQVAVNAEKIAEVEVKTDEVMLALEEVLQILGEEKEIVGSLQEDSSASRKITEESAFQILELINIALDRKLPLVTPEARKVWFDNSLAKLRAKTNDNNSEGGGDGQ